MAEVGVRELKNSTLDPSALVKLYVDEKGGEAVRKSVAFHMAPAPVSHVQSDG
jgi:hypothetical protein